MEQSIGQYVQTRLYEAEGRKNDGFPILGFLLIESVGAKPLALNERAFDVAAAGGIRLARAGMGPVSKVPDQKKLDKAKAVLVDK